MSFCRFLLFSKHFVEDELVTIPLDPFGISRFCGHMFSPKNSKIIKFTFPRFKTCCENGLDGALGWVSEITGMPQDRLLMMYSESCEGNHFAIVNEDDPEELEQEAEGNEVGENECVKFMQHLTADAKSMKRDLEQGQEETDQTHTVESSEVNQDIEQLPDREEVQKLLDPDASSQTMDAGGLPSTLIDALKRPGDRFNAFFRLLVKLRSIPGGQDHGWLPNAINARRASKKLNWFQCFDIMGFECWVERDG